MARRIRIAIYMIAVSFALSATACADATAPVAETVCDKSNPNVCH
jgi:hypothetical protein